MESVALYQEVLGQLIKANTCKHPNYPSFFVAIKFKLRQAIPGPRSISGLARACGPDPSRSELALWGGPTLKLPPLIGPGSLGSLSRQFGASCINLKGCALLHSLFKTPRVSLASRRTAASRTSTDSPYEPKERLQRPPWGTRAHLRVDLLQLCLPSAQFVLQAALSQHEDFTQRPQQRRSECNAFHDEASRHPIQRNASERIARTGDCRTHREDSPRRHHLWWQALQSLSLHRRGVLELSCQRRDRNETYKRLGAMGQLGRGQASYQRSTSTGEAP